jgi:TPR repeat protein
MISTYSSWLATHGKLWYDDKWYRIAWLISPQALMAVLVLLFWAAPASEKNVPWAKPVDPALRERELASLRDNAKSDRQAMDRLEREARGGDMSAQFYYGTLFDPSFRFSTIVQPDAAQAVDWYSRAAAQGNDYALANLALYYGDGRFVRLDYTRSCFYARKLDANSYAPSLRVKGDCYARGLGGTPVDLAQAAVAYELAANKGNPRAWASLGYFYENGLGGKQRDVAVALRYYRAAADKGDSLGLHNLGYAYNSGSLGLQRDGGEAARLIMQALENKYDVTLQSLTSRPDLWSADFWQSLQRRLEEKGIYAGAIDGRANPATLDAVRRLAARS